MAHFKIKSMREDDHAINFIHLTAVDSSGREHTAKIRVENYPDTGEYGRNEVRWALENLALSILETTPEKHTTEFIDFLLSEFKNNADECAEIYEYGKRLPYVII